MASLAIDWAEVGHADLFEHDMIGNKEACHEHNWNDLWWQLFLILPMGQSPVPMGQDLVTNVMDLSESERQKKSGSKSKLQQKAGRPDREAEAHLVVLQRHAVGRCLCDPRRLSLLAGQLCGHCRGNRSHEQDGG